MKKMLWMAALTSVALAGCVNEEVAVDNPAKQRKELTFGTPVMYNQSRAVSGEITGTTYPYQESFIVFGIEHDGPFEGWTADNVVKKAIETTDADGTTTTTMVDYFPAEGVEVTNDVAGQTYWQTAKAYYLPSDPNHKLTFTAYSPARAKTHGTFEYTATGLHIKDWVMPASPSEHYDLMYSSLSTNITEANVPIKFYHALSSIRFTFTKPSENTEDPNAPKPPYQILIKELAVTGDILNKGTFMEGLSDGTDTAADPEWNTLSKTTDAPTEYVLFGGGEDVYEVQSAVENKGSEIPDVYSFMAIPQGVNSNMKVRIKYSIQQENGGYIYENQEKTISFTDFKTPEGKIIQNWDDANRYVYHINFGALTKIYFTPSIGKDWTTQGNESSYVIELSPEEENDENTEGSGGTGSGDTPTT